MRDVRDSCLLVCILFGLCVCQARVGLDWFGNMSTDSTQFGLMSYLIRSGIDLESVSVWPPNAWCIINLRPSNHVPSMARADDAMAGNKRPHTRIPTHSDVWLHGIKAWMPFCPYCSNCCHVIGLVTVLLYIETGFFLFSRNIVTGCTEICQRAAGDKHCSEIM